MSINPRSGAGKQKEKRRFIVWFAASEEPLDISSSSSKPTICHTHPYEATSHHDGINLYLYSCRSGQPEEIQNYDA
jgi:hypothetical protein